MILKSKKVEYALANNKFSEWEKVKYLLLPMVVTALFGGPAYILKPRYGNIPSTADSMASIIGAAIVAAVTYWGLRRLYQTNGKIDGKEFILRYTILSLPVSIKFILIFTPCFAILIFSLPVIADLLNDPSIKHQGMLYFHIAIPLLVTWYFNLLNKSFKRFGAEKNLAAEQVSRNEVRLLPV